MDTNVEKKGVKTNDIASMLKNERISKGDAALILSVTIGTITNYVKRGLLSQIKLGSSKQSKVYFKRDEVLKLMDFELKQNAFQR